MSGRKYEAILLLGYALGEGDQATEELRLRVQAAARAYAQGMANVIVASGGAAPGHAVSEAAVMAELLHEAGVPEEAVVLEDAAQDTMENMRFSAQKLGGARGQRVLVVTSDYHLRRAVMTARRVGLRARGLVAALPHDAVWKRKRNQEFAYTVDLLMGWQDEGKSRPAWTYALFERVFGGKTKKRKKEGNNA